MTPTSQKGRSSALRGSMAYMSVGLAQRAIGFLLLPAYARVLAPAEYGTIALLLTVFGGAQYLLSFGLEIAVFRAYFVHSDDPAERDCYVNTLGLFLLTAPALLVALGATVVRLLLNGSGLPTGLLGAELLSAGVYVGASVMPLAVIRAQERLRDYMKINAAYAISQVVFKCVLVLGFDLGVRGWVASDLIAASVMLIASLRLLQHHWTLEFDKRHLFAALALGLPMLPHLLSQWVLSLADRLVLATLLDARRVGIYSMGYQFGILLGIALTEINRSVMPAYGRAASSDSARDDLSKTITMQILIAAGLGAATALVVPPLIHIILPSPYWAAASVVPVVALGYVFYGWYYIPMNILSVVAGDTKFISFPTMIAAALNVSLNLWLVPKWGIFAAGLTTAICYGSLLILVTAYRMRRVPWRVPIDVQPLVLSVLAILAAYVAAIFVLPSRGFPALISRSAAVVIAAVLVLLRHGAWPNIWPNSSPRPSLVATGPSESEA